MMINKSTTYHQSVEVKGGGVGVVKLNEEFLFLLGQENNSFLIFSC